MSLPDPSADAAVVVTGASSGIGEEIARELARRGYPVHLVARRRERLDELAREFSDEHGIAVTVLPVDLGDTAQRAELSRHLADVAVAGLVNSAGFGTSGAFHQLPVERERDQIVLNALAVTELTHAALPGMIARGSGAVLNVGSIAGFQPLPDAAVYSATKAFVQTFSEAVHEELRGTGVSCTALCPGPVPTAWWEIAGEPAPGGLAATSAHEVATAAVAAMRRGKRLVVPGLVPKAAGIGGRLAPRGLLLPALRRANRR